LLFQDGVSTITNISAVTKVGILFAIVIAALSSDGQDVLLNEAKLTSTTYFNMIEAFESLLCYWAWLKKDEFWDLHDIESQKSAKMSIFKLMNRLKHLFPRKNGNQWEIPKFHKQMHIAYYIWLYGSHLNIHTGPQEHNHIANSKKPRQRTQKRKKDFDWQLGNCLNDIHSIEFASNQIRSHNGANTSANISHKRIKDTSKPCIIMATKFEVSMNLETDGNKIKVEYNWLTASMKKYQLSNSFLQLISIHFFHTQSIPNQIKGIQVTGVTEYKHQNMTFRAHPCYKNDTAWYDWVLIAWNIPYVEYLTSKAQDDSPDYVELPNYAQKTDDEKQTAMLIPAKLICIIQDEQNETFAIVHSCLQLCKKVSVLSYRWQMEYENVKAIRSTNAQYVDMVRSKELTPVYHKVSIESIQKHCLIVPYKEDSQFVMEIIDEDLWANCFSIV